MSSSKATKTTKAPVSKSKKVEEDSEELISDEPMSDDGSDNGSDLEDFIEEDSCSSSEIDWPNMTDKEKKDYYDSLCPEDQKLLLAELEDVKAFLKMNEKLRKGAMKK